ncbi:MAG: tRNA lysidine(34) synthetase TilS [Alphaproteobacteria bacterium]
MDTAISASEFETLAAAVPPDRYDRVAVACSGGPDSMALVCLLHGLVKTKGGALTALTVDHGLRPESAAEAARVSSWLDGCGVNSVVLTSDRQKPASNIQMEARDLRYRLMTDWCREQGVDFLFLAHHLDDQAETFLLRLARGSGVDGLAAMQPVAQRGGVTLVRPLLAVPKARLRATLDSAGWPHVTDPSNRNDDFARVRIRALMPALAREGLDARRLAGTADRMASATPVLDDAAAGLMKAAVTLHPQGYATVSTPALLDAREETALRLLSQLLSRIGGSFYPPRFDRVQRLLAALRDGSFGAGRTAGGCRLMRKDGSTGPALLICRETAAIGSQPARQGAQVWDGRFELHLSGDVRRAVIAPLGVDGWRDVGLLSPGNRKNPVGPSPVRRGLPGLWVDGRLAAAPSLGVANPDISAPTVVNCALAPRLNALAGPFHWRS